MYLIKLFVQFVIYLMISSLSDSVWDLLKTLGL